MLLTHGVMEECKVEYPFIFRWTKRHEEFCVAENIFLNHALMIKKVYTPRNLWKLKRGRIIELSCDVWAENFASMPERSFCTMGAYSYSVGALPCEMTVGRFCSVAKGLTIMGSRHPTEWFTTHPFTYTEELSKIAGIQYIGGFDGNSQSPIIGHDVWIGGNVVLKGGITIGHGAIVGANAVVTKDIPPYAVVAGIPAKIIRFRFEENIIHKLLALEWWNYKPSDIPVHVRDINEFIKILEGKINNQEIKQHEYKKINISTEFKALC